MHILFEVSPCFRLFTDLFFIDKLECKFNDHQAKFLPLRDLPGTYEEVTRGPDSKKPPFPMAQYLARFKCEKLMGKEIYLNLK